MGPRSSHVSGERRVALVSAENNDQLAPLRTTVREALIEFLRREHPEAMPAALPAPSPPAG